MLDIVIDAVLNDISQRFAKYGLPLETQYNSDLEMISQYTSSLNLRYMFQDKDLNLLSQSDLKNLGSESYNLLLYKYSPLKKEENRFNNLNLQLVFDPEVDQKEVGNIGPWQPTTQTEPDFDEDGNWYQLFNKIRSVNEADVEDPYVKDLVMASITLTFKLLTSSTDYVNKAQFLYVSQLHKRNPIITIPLDLGGAGTHEFEYTTDYTEIDDVGHVDYQRFGNLQHLTFSTTITGPIFSFYQTREKYLKEIDLKLSVLPKE